MDLLSIVKFKINLFLTDTKIIASLIKRSDLLRLWLTDLGLNPIADEVNSAVIRWAWLGDNSNDVSHLSISHL